jgi:catechol 2,3-dioxygenase-like lactoylglutathione lyase family enzyme
MTRILAALSLLFMAFGMPAMAQTAPETDGWLKRQALIVSDMERSLSLYAGVLGFTPGEVSTSGATSYSYDVFAIPKKARMRFATLDGRDNQIRSLALIEVTGAKLPKPAKGIRPTATVINTRQLDVVKAKVAALGLKSVPERAAVTADGDPMREWAFIDWDGHLIVLYQLTAR